MKWTDVVWRALLYYGHWLMVVVPYYFAKTYVEVTRKEKELPAFMGEKVRSYVGCFLIVGIFILMAGDRLGTHREGGDFDAPGDLVVDWEPTDTQRIEHALKLLLVYLPSAFLGLAIGYAQDERLRARLSSPFRAYGTTNLPFWPRGRQLVIDLSGLPEGNKDILEIFISREGARVIVSGPHRSDTPIEAHDGWGPHCANTLMGRSKVQIMKGVTGEFAAEVSIRESARASLETFARRRTAHVDSSGATTDPS